MSYAVAQPSLRTVSYMRQVYAALTGLSLVAGGAGFIASRLATKPPTALECGLLFLGIVFTGGFAYCVREEEGLNAFCLIVFAGLVGWLGGVVAIEHEVVVATVYFSAMASLCALWVWSLASNQQLNFWSGFLWCALVSLLVLQGVRTAYPDAKDHLVPIAGTVAAITQLYLLGSSWSIAQKPPSESAWTGTADLLFESLGDALTTADCIEVLFQILFSFFG